MQKHESYAEEGFAFLDGCCWSVGAMPPRAPYHDEGLPLLGTGQLWDLYDLETAVAYGRQIVIGDALLGTGEGARCWTSWPEAPTPNFYSKTTKG